MSKIKKIFKDTPESRIYFCSDLHYNHANVIKHSSRPFSDVEKMNQEIISQLKTLRETDILFDLGDLFWGLGEKDCIKVLNNCKAQIFKIMGNHDKELLWRSESSKLKNKVQGIYDLLDIQLENEEGEIFMITLSHYPICSWNHKSYGSINLHGHCHGSYDEINSKSKELRIDVGWDAELANKTNLLTHWSKIERKLHSILGINLDENITMTKLYNHVKTNKLKL